MIEKKIELPANPDEWVDFLMDLSKEVESFKVETNCGSILVYSTDTIYQGRDRLSYFDTSMDPCKCFHDIFNKACLKAYLPLSNIKEVTAVYK